METASPQIPKIDRCEHIFPKVKCTSEVVCPGFEEYGWSLGLDMEDLDNCLPCEPKNETWVKIIYNEENKGVSW